MKRLFLLLMLAALSPMLVNAQAQPVTAKWTADQQLVLSELPSRDQPVEMATPANRLGEPDELKDICARMSNEWASWTLSDDGKQIFIRINQSAYPEWDKEMWQIHLTRTAGVYLMK